ncbi:hypothetical protein Tco_0823879 [Tanacetum coccineum]|uniref:Uncharacterized protein n=1 Tax=Tanacetum coccineum TaxID=301880 RepID=A0ABQ5AJ57_9ASTR
MEAQYGRFLDMIRAVRINVPLVDVLAGMPNYGKFLKELVSNKHKLEQISSDFLSDESFTMIQNKVPPKLGDPGSFLIPCNFSKAFSCNALADGMKRTSEKRMKNQAKMDKTEHVMEKHGKVKVKVKVEIEEMINGPIRLPPWTWHHMGWGLIGIVMFLARVNRDKFGIMEKRAPEFVWLNCSDSPCGGTTFASWQVWPLRMCYVIAPTILVGLKTICVKGLNGAK